MPLLGSRSSRSVPSPVTPLTITVMLLPLVTETFDTVPAAVPVAVSWKSLAAMSYTILVKTTS